MKKHIGISIIIPVYNAREWIIPTVDHIVASLKGTHFDAEIIIVDDGSTDGSLEVARSITTPKYVDIRVIAQRNKGRYLARKKGVSKSKKENVLFIDSRVYIDGGALSFLEGELKLDTDQIWNGHVRINKRGNIFARFWDAVVGVAWHRYFRKPRTMSYSAGEFDHFPKGTGFFYVSKSRLLSAMKYFEDKAGDLRHSSDDTLLIRHLIKGKNIHISPNFSCLYHGRSTMGAFLKHAYARGQFFVDGFLRRGTRFFYPLIGVYLLFIATCILLIASPVVGLSVILVGSVLFVAALFFGSLLYGVSIADAGALATLGVPFAVVYFAGICRGTMRKITNKKSCLNGYRYLKNESLEYRNALGGTLREYFLVGLVYLLAVVALTKGTLLNISHSIFASIGDATSGFMWLNYADPSLNPVLAHTDLVNYPVGEDLGGPSFITYSLLWLPMRFFSFLFDPVTSLNIMMLIGFMSAALMGYWLIKKITGNYLVAFFAGYAIAFTPYALIKSSAHLSYIFSAVFIALMAAFIGLWMRPTFKRSILFGLVVAAAFYTDGYFILLATVTVVGLLIGGVLYGLISRFSIRDFLLRIKYGLIALIIFLVAISPLMFVQLTQGSQVKQSLASARSNIEGEMRSYNANPIDFLAPSEYSPTLNNIRAISEMNAYRQTHSNTSENTNYIGYGILILGAFGLAILLVNIIRPKSSSLRLGGRRQNIILTFCVVSISVPLFLTFMFSPEIVIFGREVPLPGRFMIDHDITLWRVMSRFYVPLHVFIVVFAAISLYLLYRLIYPSHNRSAVRKAIALSVVCFFMICTAAEYAVNIPARPYNMIERAPALYSWLSKQKDIHVVAELPLVDPLDGRTADYLTFQMTHEKKLVNMKDPHKERLHGALGDYNNPEVLDFLRLRKVDAVITRADSCKTYVWGRLLRTSSFVDRAKTQMCLYKLLPSTATDDLFMVYEDGFTPAPNSPDQSEVVFDKSHAKMSVRQSDLQTSTHTKAKVTARLNNLSGDTMRWRIMQDGEIIQQGVITSPGYEHYADINVFIAADKPIYIMLDTKDSFSLGQATLRDVVVTRLH